jgi:tRNA(Ser,Leu) C12 N-acetylase TAN1
MSGKDEIHNVLTKLGDQKAEQELLVPGIIGVKTNLDAREVVEEVREMYAGDPNSLSFTLRWVPVDYWCDATIDKIKTTVKEEIKDLFTADDQYFVDVVNHRSGLQNEHITETIALMLKGKVNPDHPQKVIRIELFDKRACVSLLKPADVFSVIKS